MYCNVSDNSDSPDLATHTDTDGEEGQSGNPMNDQNPKPNIPHGAILVNDEHKSRFPSRNINDSTEALVDQSTDCKDKEKAETNQQAAQQLFLDERKESSLLRIIFLHARKKEDIQCFFCDKLAEFVIDIEETIYEHAHTLKGVVVHFSCDVTAMRVCQLLSCEKEISSVELVSEIFQRIHADNDYHLVEHEKRIESLKGNLAQLLNKKKINIDEYQRISEEKEALKLKVNECEKQRDEFTKYVQNHLACSPYQIGVSLLNDLEAKMVRECNHLSSALPIYARRSEIVETVLKSQVTVLVGETGSGKSTQVVQYLYDAGVAQHGVIVCTQPRKVAAISLAKHVSREMHVNLGEELGYKVGMNEKCCKKTKIVYMTDHMLLNECIADRDLSKYSCILIDEAHERSINTDMLLAFIKQCLPSRRDLKLVVMSATIEPELFVKYFKTRDEENNVVSTIMVSGRTFPVEVLYDPLHSGESLSTDNDYVMNAVDLVRSIHTKQPPGDILVFLTCAPEIEKACKAVEYLHHEAIILPLHGKLPPEEQQKVFNDSGSKRKIIFSTNVAETSVTIPGVKYVVDTGLAKEMHFDSRKSMDSLEVSMISKSSAEQRKGRAGRVSSGKCYRLYTTDDYESQMPDRSKPEILRIQLSQVVLKMLEFGVPNVLTFDFVEHPDRVALEAAVDTLRSVGAIENNSLTELGRKMAVLPLQPQLSKVLLDGIDAGVGTEALICVALSSLAGQVFFRGGTDEEKEESDKKKLPFCHEMGDQMTSLSVYQCWQEQDMSQRREWCFDNSVNAKSMRIVEETVKELGHILKKKLNISLNRNLQSLEAAECYIGKLYFDAFIHNLAVNLGHHRAGYMTTALPNSTSSFLIFPGSSLYHLGTTPKYVLYERTLKTSRQFLTQVMSVKQEWIDEAVKTGRLPEDPAVTFADYIFLPFHASHTGPQTLKEIVLKRMQLVEVSTGLCAVSPVFDFSPEPKKWGVVRVIAQRRDHNNIQLVVGSAVQEIQEKLKEQTNEFGLTKERDRTRAVIGAGGTVQEMIMPYQFRSVIAVCSNEISEDEVKICLENYGKVKSTKVIRRNVDEFRLSVTYSTASEAKQAMKEFESPVVHLYPHKGQQFTLRLEWQRRERAPHAFLSFDSPQHCEAAFSNLGFVIQYRVRNRRYNIKVSPDKYNKRDKLFLAGDILCYCDEQLLKETIGSYTSINFSLKMGYRKYTGDYPCLRPEVQKATKTQPAEYCSEDEDSEYSSEEEDNVSTSSKDDLEQFKKSMEDHIKSIICKYSELGKFHVSLEIPREWDINFRAYVTFDDPDEGYKVMYSDLNEEYIHDKHLHVSPSLKCMLAFKQEVYILIRDEIEKARKDLLRCYSNLVYIKVIPPDKKVQELTRISLRAFDVKVFSMAQKKLYDASQPCTLHCNTTELQEYILCQDCHKHLESTKETTSTYICRDPRTMMIKIYGDNKNKETARALIEERAKQLFTDGACVTELSLRGDDRPQGLMKYLVTRYGYDLSGMMEFEGVRRITLNPHFQQISVLATKTGRDAVTRCIEETSLSSQVPHYKTNGEYDFECSACFTSIDEAREMVRLECCGHGFHVECIEIQLKPDTLTLPVQCAKEDCSKNFVLKDFENLQKRLKIFRMPVLVSAAVQCFLEKNSDTYKNCPTPDCKMIYIQTEISKEFICSSCSVSTCSKCHEQYHAGLSCEVYKASRRSDKELEDWMKEDPQNRKKCPQCHTPIEKQGGCQHMACKCGTHICWRCMKCFKGVIECYDHQSDCLAARAPPVEIQPVIPPALAAVNPQNQPPNAPLQPVNQPPVRQQMAQPQLHHQAAQPPVHHQAARPQHHRQAARPLAPPVVAAPENLRRYDPQLANRNAGNESSCTIL